MSSYKASQADGNHESVGLVGLRNTATKNKLTDTIVPLWELQSTEMVIPPAESFNHTNPGAESVIGGDERVLVDRQHFLPGGKYRSIVKLFLKYEHQNEKSNWPIATGWLIRPDLLVTAGHCAFDWGHNLGRLVQVKCYIGYNGQESIKDPKAQVQFRQGKRIATTLEWMTAKGNRNFDVSFIQVNAPFTGIDPYRFVDTPLSGNLNIGVVGYPGDLRDKKTDEPGAHMYEMFLPTRYNLAESQWRMLEYQIDTYGGNSGSPVLREEDHVSIGVHVYGGSPNSASVIGLYGNPFLDYVAAFDLNAVKVSLPGVPPTPGVQYITVPTKKTPDAVKEVVDLTAPKFALFNKDQGFVSHQGVGQMATGGYYHDATHDSHWHGGHHAIAQEQQSFGLGGQHSVEGFGSVFSNIAAHSGDFGSGGYNSGSLQSTQQFKRLGNHGGSEAALADEEGFGDFLKKAIKVGGPIASNVLGTALPMALGPLGGPIASLANIALSAAGKLAESGGTESLGGGPVVPEGTAERAIMAEAAFQAMMKMNNHTLAEEGFFSDMWQVAKKIAPVVKQVAPHVLTAVGQPALGMALQTLTKTESGGTESNIGDLTKKVNTAAIRTRVRVTSNVPATGADAFLARFQNAARAESDTEGLFTDLLGVAKRGIKIAGPVLSTAAKVGLPILQGMMTESDFGEAAGPLMPFQPPHSILGNTEGMHERVVLAEAALQAAMKAPQHKLEEEGFFSFMADAVKKIAPVVIKAAPGVIQAVAPTVAGLLGGKGESWAPNMAATLRKQPSMTRIGGHQSNSGFRGLKDSWSELQDHHDAGLGLGLAHRPFQGGID